MASLVTVTESISLTFAPPQELVSVATLVAGGVAGRFGLSVERVGDLQLALSTVLDGLDGDAPVTLELDIDDALACRLGPLRADVEELLPIVRRLADAASVDQRDDGLWLCLSFGAAHPAEAPAS